jgi:hypothetical protein
MKKSNYEIPWIIIPYHPTKSLLSTNIP